VAVALSEAEDHGMALLDRARWVGDPQNPEFRESSFPDWNQWKMMLGGQDRHQKNPGAHQ
jgi:hypothetical protein